MQSMRDLSICLLRKDAHPPKRRCPTAAGYDLIAVENVVVPARGRAVVGTGVAVCVPDGCYGRITSSMSLARDKGLVSMSGPVDHREEIQVVMFNHSETNIMVGCGECVGHLVLERVHTPFVRMVQTVDDFPSRPPSARHEMQ